MRTRKGLTARPGVDPAVAAARAVVGLYGDAGVSWSIMLDCELARPVTLEQVASTAAGLVAAHPHLGRTPVPVPFDASSVGGVLQEFADRPYGDQDPLLRLAVSTDGRRLVLAVHHGAMDGLGMLAAVGRLIGEEATSSARGVAREGAVGRGFVRSSVSRLANALVRPPQRFVPSAADGRRTQGGDDWLLWGDLDVTRIRTSDLVAATRRVLASWNGGSTMERRPVVIASGVSHRPVGDPLQPDRVTGYVRLLANDAWSSDSAAALLKKTPPEPDFPATRGGGVGPLVTRMLASRLGSSALVTNIGRVSAGDALEAVRIWASASGPSGVAIGLASAGSRTGLTVRARRRDFDRGAVETLFGSLVRELESPTYQ